MRRLYAWIAGSVGGLAAYRLVARRRRTAAVPEPPASEPDVDPRAEALRAKLDESRQPEAVEPEAGASASASDAAEAEPTGAEVNDPEARRQAVHEHGRAAVEEMRSSEEAAEEPQ